MTICRGFLPSILREELTKIQEDKQTNRSIDRRETKKKKNQSVDNAGVAFVKGANERNEFFEKLNKQ